MYQDKNSFFFVHVLDKNCTIIIIIVIIVKCTYRAREHYLGSIIIILVVGVRLRILAIQKRRNLV